ncbi:MAG: SHD1 domain-containing protein [Rubripirellula sp.]
MKRTPLLFTTTCCLCLAFGESALSQSLNYEIKKGQVIPYRVAITAETPTKVDTMTGLIAYTGKGLEGEVLTIEYKGGLTKATKSKGRSSGPMRGGFRGRPGGGPPRGPFDQPDFRGLTPSTNTLAITTKGVVERMRSDSQLPYVLGNLSMMPFERLPADGETNWEDGSSLTITSKEETSRFGPRFGPFARGGEETKTGGGESSKFKIESADETLVTIRKTYSLSSPAATSKDTGLEMKGTGTWVFNRELGVSESMDFKIDLTVTQENSSTKIPLMVKWNRIPEQEYNDFLEKRKKDREEALAKARKPAAAVKISDANKKRIMSRLGHSQWGVVWGELKSLSRSRMSGLVAEDMDLMVLVAGLRSHSNSQVKTAADAIWKKWGESFEKLATSAQKADAAGTSDTGNPFALTSDEDGKGIRFWSDNTGKFKIEAEFRKLDGANVVLTSKDGKEIKVPRSRLSKSDQALIDRLAE